MDSIKVFLRLGWDHIFDLNAWDHLLFLGMLCIRFVFADWKPLAFRITAFALGHSATTLFAALAQWSDSSGWVEFGIASSVALTALFNLAPGKKKPSPFEPQTVLALLFGLIHGLGFGAYFAQLPAADQNLAMPLLGFTLGIELAQLSIALGLLSLWAVLESAFGWKHREWVLIWTGAGLAWSLSWCIQKWPFA
jgi:hypothetical protein